MVMHLQKLCVGVESIEGFQASIDFRRDEAKARGRRFEQSHTTRTMPKQREEILRGGSLYWVIKGVMQARQHILDLESVVGADGVNRCKIILEPRLIQTVPRPKRPFQGWRYLKPAEAPRDVGSGNSDDDDLPPALRSELAELGLL